MRQFLHARRDGLLQGRPVRGSADGPLQFFPIDRLMYYLYILECADGTLYTGITVDLERRLKEHSGSGLGARYTRARRPVKLVYSEEFPNRSTASSAESRIKRLSRE